MAQTTDALSNACATVEVSIDGCVNWTDISGSTQSVSGTEQGRQSGEVYTFEGEGPIIKRGKKEPLELVFAIVYTEEALEPYELARAIFEEDGCNGEICVRWSPAGGVVGTYRYTAFGPIINFIYPPIDASTASPIMGGFTVKVGEITPAVIAS